MENYLHRLNKSKLYLIPALLFISLIISSCGLFDKELKQDKHIAMFRNQMNRVTDSLNIPQKRVEAFETIIQDINEDDALISTRKKNLLLVEANMFLIKEYFDIQNYNKAMHFSNEVLNIDSMSARGYYSRGCVLQAMKNDSLAMLDYNKALAINTEYADAYYNRALIYEKQDKPDSALADYNNALKLNPPYVSEIYHMRAEIFTEKKEFEKAIKDYDKLMSIDSANVALYYKRASVYDSINNYEKAIADYKKTIEIDSLDKFGFNTSSDDAIKRITPLMKKKNKK